MKLRYTKENIGAFFVIFLHFREIDIIFSEKIIPSLYCYKIHCSKKF